MRRIFFLALLWVISNNQLYAQRHKFVFDQISIAHGLSENTIRCILEDSKGFIWFCSEDGLNRFDGRNFLIFREDLNDTFSISSNNVTYATEYKGDILLATRLGFNIYDRELMRFYNHKNNVYPFLKELNNNTIHIAVDEEDKIWISVHTQGLVTIDLEAGTMHKYKLDLELPNNDIQIIKPNGKGKLLVGITDGLLEFDTKTKKYRDLRPKYGRDYAVYDIQFLGDKIYLATSDGVKVITRSTDEVKEYTHIPGNTNTLSNNEIRAVVFDDVGNLICGVDGGGIDYLDFKENKVYHNTSRNFSNLSSDNVISMIRDSKKSLWVGTYMQGLNYSNASTNLFSLYQSNSRSSNSLSPGTVTNFHQDSTGGIWIGTDGSGLNYYEPKTETFKHYTYSSDNPSGISSNKVIWIMESRDGKIWLATYGGGVNCLDPATGKFTHYKHDKNDHFSLANDKVKVVYEDKDGNIWCGTYGSGLSILNRETGKFKHYRFNARDPSTITSNWISTIYEDKKGTVWVGTYDGLCMFIPGKGRFRGFQHNPRNPTSIAHNYVNDIFEDSRGNFWIGTLGAGICLMDRKSEEFENFTTEDGLSNNNVEAIIEDETLNLWLSTKSGITKFKPFEKKGKSYRIEDGLPSSTFYSNAKFLTSSGHVYFGANNGFIDINPFDAKRNKDTANTVITEFLIFNQKVPIGMMKKKGKELHGDDIKNDPTKEVKEFHRGKMRTYSYNLVPSPLKKDITETKVINLDYNQNSITFKFAMLNYVNPQRNQYEYMLEGFDKTWVNNRNRDEASYTNLDPGEYVFRVKASNNDGLWKKQPTEIRIIITPPFWRTLWFRILVGVFVAALIFVLFKLRIRSIKKKNEKLEVEVAIRTEEVREQKEEIERQKNEIQDNISVGKIIQESILPPLEYIQKDFPDSFVYYKPKDIVSGDFYWYHKEGGKIYMAAVDCTGHGVAGAFMSIIGYNILNEISNNIKGLSAAEILNQLNEGVIETLNQRHTKALSRDGMDIALIIIDPSKKKLQFSGAMNSLYVVRNTTARLETIDADKFSIGIPRKGEVKQFTNKEVELHTGDSVYLFSDGYADQFGGPQGESKFLYSRFREMLSNFNGHSGDKKKEIIRMTMQDWMGEEEQLDDMLVMGIRF